MHKGETVEEQVTGVAVVGGIQFDVYPRRVSSATFYPTKPCDHTGKPVRDTTGFPFVATATPAELQLERKTVACTK